MKGKRHIAVFLAVMMVLSLALSSCATKEERQQQKEEKATESKIKKIVSEMTAEQKIAQLLVLRFKTWGIESDAKPVTQLNSQQESLLKKYGFGGVIVYTENMQTAEQSVKLIQAMRNAAKLGGAKADLLISIDQEGGYITRLATGTQMPGNMALGAANDAQTTQNVASVMGQELKALGVDLDYAPDVDINNNPANPIIGIRSFSDDPQIVASMGQAFVKGLQSAGTAACLKHFPGHGNTDTDSHTGLPLIQSSLEELEKLELVPFKACAADADMVMSAHIQYPKIETGTYTSKATGEKIYLPATLSKTMLTDILREKLGFKGVISTDAMIMEAITEHFDLLEASKMAILAGADVILLPMETRTDAEISSLEKYIKGLVAMVVSGDIPAERLDDAVTRILTLKAKYGRLEFNENADIDEMVNKAKAAVGSKANHDVEFTAAKKAVTLLKNQNALPLKAAEKTVIVCPYASEKTAIEYTLNKLKDEGVISKSAPVSVLCYTGMTSEAEKIASDVVNVVAVSTMYSQSDLDPAKTDWTNFLDSICSAIHKKGGRFIAISAQLPYDTARFTSADAIMAVYSARGMTRDPGNFAGDTPQYGANIPAAIYAVFGAFSPSGKMPVNIPRLNSDYSYSSEILFPAGTGLSW